MLFVPALVVMDKAFTTQGGWTTDDDLVDAWKAYVNGTMDSQEIYIIIAYHCRALLGEKLCGFVGGGGGGLTHGKVMNNTITNHYMFK